MRNLSFLFYDPFDQCTVSISANKLVKKTFCKGKFTFLHPFANLFGILEPIEVVRILKPRRSFWTLIVVPKL